MVARGMKISVKGENMEYKYPQRKCIRLKEYDYSLPGYYFITICTQNRERLLSRIVGATCGRPEIELLSAGKIVDNEMNKIEIIYDNVLIDEYIIMPNHIHMIVILENGRTKFAPTIIQIVKQFKGSITKQLGYSVWQKSFYEHVIRNEKSYYKIVEYIQSNPYNWENDEYYK
ncbi:MAG: hypothetical protein FWC68_01265 [Oscillospiraceae bacterium]|nr:hypothetical protein [Oscillospiraceae bacterium]